MAYPAAPMGYIGSVSLFDVGVVRVSSCSLARKQAIDHPDVIDGTVDWTLYQLKGIECEGDVRLPVTAGGGATLSSLFDLATQRDLDTGELVHDGTVVVAYGGGPQSKVRTFSGCKINTFELKATAGEVVEATIGIWGQSAVDGGLKSHVSGAPVRCLAWADILVTGVGDGCLVKELTMTIANNLQRNYTFCPASGYFPNNISTGKRHISGSLGFQGFAPTEDSAWSNKDHDNPQGGSLIIAVAGGGFSKTFLNITYELQTIEAQPGVITSTANWYAHADGGGQAFS